MGWWRLYSEVVLQRYSNKNLFGKTSQNPQNNACDGAIILGKVNVTSDDTMAGACVWILQNFSEQNFSDQLLLDAIDFL